MMHKITIRWLFVLGCSVLTLSLTLDDARGQSDSLKAQREGVYSRIRDARAKRGEAAEKAGSLRADLQKCQARLKEAQDEFAAAQRRELQTRQAIVDTEKSIEATKKELAEAQEQFSERLVAMHKAGEVRFLEVFVGARDFSDLAGRSYLFERLARYDAQVVQNVETRRVEAERKAVELQKQRSRVAEERAKIDAAKRRIADETAKQEQLTRAAQGEVDAWKQKIAELEAESEAITQSIRSMTSGGKGYSGRWSGGWVRPVDGPIVSGFGMRMHPIAHVYRMHTGVDISAGSGTSVGAAGGGKVISTGSNGGYGNCVIIDHGGGRTTLYAHLSSITCADGQIVSPGQRIGLVGTTGYSTGPHLHFEVRVNGSPINPLG
jgi:murein DD-endopeptidase MepM/ murein hydrolase activator NlpD